MSIATPHYTRTCVCAPSISVFGVYKAMSCRLPSACLVQTMFGSTMSGLGSRNTDGWEERQKEASGRKREGGGRGGEGDREEKRERAKDRETFPAPSLHLACAHA